MGVEVAAQPLLGAAAIDIDSQLEDRTGSGRSDVAIGPANGSLEPSDESVRVES
jgi:hypothetical protein